jgi:dihydroorotase
VTIIDPDLEWTMSEDILRSRSSNTPYLGKSVRGAVTTTVVDGEVVYRRREGS